MDMDILSEFPDHILVCIISLLPLKDMVRTSLLSRRWRHVWTQARAFDFTNVADDDGTVDISRIDRCLKHLSASPDCVTIPSIVFPGIQDFAAVDRWIRFAAAHNVATLQFALWISHPAPIPLPLSLFQLCRGLTALHISQYEILAVPAPAVSPAFPFLRSLSLVHVAIADPQAFFAHCPAVDSLSVDLSDDNDLLPASALRSCPRLSTLSLSYCTVPGEPPSAGPPVFPSLSALRLENVRVAALQSLLHMCPVIAELRVLHPPEDFTFRLDPRRTVPTPGPSHPSPSSSLRRLVLSDLKIADLPALVRAFQELELLSLERVWTVPGANSGIQVRAPRMRHLMVQDSEELGPVVIADAPQLCRLFYWGDIRFLRVFRRAVPNLEEAFLHSTVENPFRRRWWKNLMRPLSHVRLLSVNWWFIHEFMQRCRVGSPQLIFGKLEEFHWWPVFKKHPVGHPFGMWYTERLSKKVVLSLLDFLKCCPNVEHLCIVSAYAMPESTPPVVPSAEDNNNDSELTEDPGISQSLLPQLKKFTVYKFFGGPGDRCLLRFVGLRGRDLQHIRLHCVEGTRAATPGVQSAVRHYFSACSPHAILQFVQCSPGETCPRHKELRRYTLYD